MERKISAIAKGLERGKRRWVERGVFVYRERATGRVRFGLSYQVPRSDGSKVRRRELLPSEVESLAEAKRQWRARHTDIDRGDLVVNVATIPTFAQFADMYLHDRKDELHRSLQRARTALKAACSVFGALDVDKVNTPSRGRVQAAASCDV